MDPQGMKRLECIIKITREALTCTADRSTFVAKACSEANIPEREIWLRIRAHELTPAIAANWEEHGAHELGRRYRLGKPLGKGAHGMVYLAVDTVNGEQVAIKFLTHVNSDFQLRTHPEVMALHKLSHPHIIQLVDTNHIWSQEPEKYKDWFYIATEYVEGGSLEKRLYPEGRPSDPEMSGVRLGPDEAARIVQDVADAVQYAHERNLLHRDLKPANILLTPKGHAKLTDFGLAKTFGPDRVATNSVDDGTLQYMAPEQLRDKAIGPAADVYALGVILYEALTGKHPFPFTGKSLTLSDRICREWPTPPRRLDPKIPAELETICLRCLHKIPRYRPPSAAAVRDNLRRFLEASPITIRRVGRIGRLLEWCRVRPAAAAIRGLGLLVLLTTVAASWYNWAAIRAKEDLEVKTREIGEKDAEVRQKAGLVRRRKYVSDMLDCQPAWERGEVDRVRERVSSYESPPADDDPRGFEWYYWQRLCNSGLRTLTGHQAPVFSVGYGSDSQRLVTVSRDGRVKVWDARSGSILFEPKGEFVGAALAGKERLATADIDTGVGKVRLWDLRAGKEILVYKRAARIVRLAFSPDGKRLAGAVSWPPRAIVWETDTGKLVRVLGASLLDRRRGLEGHTGSVMDVAFSPDGALLATASTDKTVKVWDLATGAVHLTCKGHTGPVTSVAFSSDDGRLVSGSNGFEDDVTGRQVPGEIRVWERATGMLKLTIQRHIDSIPLNGPSTDGKNIIPLADMRVCFSRDGRRVASTGDSMARLWDAVTGQPVIDFRGHSGRVLSVALSPDGCQLASGGEDRTVKIWNAMFRQESRPLTSNAGAIGCAAFSADGLRCVTADGRVLKVWDTSIGREIAAFGQNGAPSAIACSADGRLCATSDPVGKIYIWDGNNGEKIAEIHEGGIRSLAFSPDGRRLVSGGRDNALKVWDLDKVKLAASFLGHDGPVRGVCWSPNGGRVASAGEDGKVILWTTDPAPAKKAVLTGHEGHAMAVAFSPDGQLVASSGTDKTIRVWDASTGKARFVFHGHTREVGCVVFSRDGKRLISSSGSYEASTNRPGEIKIWELLTGQECLTLKGTHRDIFLAIALGPDGRRLIAAVGDGVHTELRMAPGEIRVWGESSAPERITDIHPLKVPVQVRNIEIKELPPAAADLLPQGSVWKGTRTYREGAFGGGTVTYELNVREREGTKFKGHVFDNGPGRNRAEVTGEITGEAITWRERSVYNPEGEMTMQGTLHGNAIRLKFKGYYGKNRPTNEGDGQLKRDLNSRDINLTGRDKPRSPPPAADLRLQWVHDRGVFEQVAEKVWFERVDNRQHYLREVTRTVECVELHRTERRTKVEEIGVRLTRESALLKVDKRPWAQLYKGGWRALDRSLLRVLTAHEGKVRHVAFSPDGRHLLSGSNSHFAEIRGGKRVNFPGTDNTVRLWEVGNGKQILVLRGHQWEIMGLAFCPTDSQLAAACSSTEWATDFADPTVTVYNLESGNLQHRFTLPPRPAMRGITLSADGKRVIVCRGNHTLEQWDLVTKKELPLVTLENSLGENALWCVAFTADRRRVVGGLGSGVVRRWDAMTGKAIGLYLGHTRRIQAVAFSLDEKRIASASDDGTVRVWEVGSKKELHCLTGHGKAIRAGSDKDKAVCAVAFSRDGRWLLSGGLDGTVRLWDAKTGKELRRFDGHTDGVRDVAISPNGRLAASCSDDRTIRIWKLP